MFNLQQHEIRKEIIPDLCLNNRLQSDSLVGDGNRYGLSLKRFENQGNTLVANNRRDVQSS